jgi:CheY-like chemotaxis protein
MKTDPESSAAPAEHLSEELLPQLSAIVELAERLKVKSEGDENVQQILMKARGLLDVVNRESAHTRKSGHNAGSTSDARCDVLYIEDDSMSFASVKLLLGTKRALKVLAATSGEAGVALAQTHHPKLILLDLSLPDTHGSEVIQRLQKDPGTTRIPVIVISGDATPSQIERLLVLGARNYLTKPFEPAPFLAVIDEVMQANVANRTA